jgi:type II secretion system protein N
MLERMIARARGLVGEGRQTGSRRTVLVYAGFTLVVFAVCFLATFPHDLLLQRALRSATANAPYRVETGPGSLGWTLGYGLESLRVLGRTDEAEPYLFAERLRFAPSRLGLLRGDPFPVGIDAALYGGTMRAVVDPRPGSFQVNGTIEGVDLGRYSGLRPWVEGAVRGRLDAVVALDGAGRGPASANGTVGLKIPGLTLEGVKVRGITVPDLHFGDVHLNGTVKNGRVEVNDLVADGEEASLRGAGNVLLREPLDASVVSLELTVTPAATATDAMKMMVNMLPGGKAENGGRRMNVVGTLGKPSLR